MNIPAQVSNQLASANDGGCSSISGVGSARTMESSSQQPQQTQQTSVEHRQQQEPVQQEPVQQQQMQQQPYIASQAVPISVITAAQPSPALTSTGLTGSVSLQSGGMKRPRDHAATTVTSRSTSSRSSMDATTAIAPSASLQDNRRSSSHLTSNVGVTSTNGAKQPKLSQVPAQKLSKHPSIIPSLIFTDGSSAATATSTSANPAPATEALASSLAFHSGATLSANSTGDAAMSSPSDSARGTVQQQQHLSDQLKSSYSAACSASIRAQHNAQHVAEASAASDDILPRATSTQSLPSVSSVSGGARSGSSTPSIAEPAGITALKVMKSSSKDTSQGGLHKSIKAEPSKRSHNVECGGGVQQFPRSLSCVSLYICVV